MEGHQLMDWLRSRWDWIVRNKFLTCVIVFAVGLLVFGVVMVCRHWGWIVTESGSTIIRNLGLVIGGLIAIGLAYWRSIVADRQAKASQQQAETSQRGLLNERYQKGAEMLGSEVLSVRMGGIYALQRLAEDEPEQYHVQIMRLFCAFVRHPTKEKEGNAGPDGTERKPNRIREDVQAALTAIRNRRYGSYGGIAIALEKKEHFRLSLTSANLTDADLIAADLTGADLADADLNRANLISANLTDANLTDANLTDANLADAYLTAAILTGAILTDANLTGANLTGADFSEAKGLTQKQLDQACADPGNPPQLGGLCDAETGARLEWRGQPCAT